MRNTYVNRGPAVPALLCAAILLSACGGGSSSGANGSGGSNPGLAGSIQFDASGVSVNEDGGTATLTITRTGGTAGAVSVALVSSDGSAIAGQDYTALSTSLTFADGSATAQTVTVQIADDGDAEADETLRLALSAPTGGASVGSNGTTTLTVLDNDPPGPPVLTVTADIKQLVFEWASVPGASRYRLLRNPDGASGFGQVGADHAPGVTQATLDVAVHRHDWLNALYRLEACNADRCSASGAIGAIDAMVQAIGYFKASNTQRLDAFGFATALSADGRTLAVGAVFEDSGASGVGSDQNNDNAEFSGAVYVFAREGTQWSQQVYLKSSNSEMGDIFGHSLALSADGNTLAVGAEREDSSATGVGGAQNNDNAEDSGAVYVFTRAGVQWSQQAYVKASNTDVFDFFGSSLALSADGHTLAVGATGEDSAATGVGGPHNNNAQDSGAVYVFTRDGVQWSQQAYVKASNTQSIDRFGSALALSPDGDTLAVGAELEDSAATAVGGPQNDDGAQDSGAVYVFTRDGLQWSQQAYVKAPNTNPGDLFGAALALSADGHILAVGARHEGSAVTGVDGAQDDNNAPRAGAVYVFERDGVQWSHRTYLKASNTQTGDNFGFSLALSADGHALAVGALFEGSDATGVGGNQGDDGAQSSGAVYVFKRAEASWLQQAYVKASNTDASDFFGRSIALSADGDVLAVGTVQEASAATGIDGDQTNNNADQAGAVYIY
jgi:trimeric autotransporter adhesin